MEFSDNVNYVVLSNNIDKKFMSKFGVYQIIDVLPFEILKNNLEMFPSKRVIFNESLSSLSNKEKKEIFDLLDKQNINYVNVTSNIEDALFGDYIIVYDEDMKVLEGNKEVVLKNEKLLKKLGFGVPFVVDLSIQLMYYDILDKVYFDVDNLLEALWN
ncbi:hypothetical protein EGP99_02180 [bacterium]|nr:hypothetical protein [bacterium]